MSAIPLPPRQESIVLPFLVFSLLLLLLLIPEVIWRKPIVTDQERREWVGHHQEGSNAVLARHMIRDLLPSPPTRWSQDTVSFEVGNGIWYSHGAVGVASPDGREISNLYEIFFIPYTTPPLYYSIGSQSMGDRAAVIRRAQMKLGQP